MAKFGTKLPKHAYAMSTTHGTVTSVREVLRVLEAESTTRPTMSASVPTTKSGMEPTA